MQLSSDKSLLAESKVLILYILYKANKPLTNEEFLKLVLSVTDMNYFYFQQFLLDLLNTKYVISYKKEDLEKDKLEKLQEDLKQAIREERYEDAAKIRDEIKKMSK